MLLFLYDVPRSETPTSPEPEKKNNSNNTEFDAYVLHISGAYVHEKPCEQQYNTY